MNNFGKILKKIRTERGLSAKDIAKGIGVHYATILNWEKGKGKPTLLPLIKLSIFLNVKADVLLGIKKT